MSHIDQKCKYTPTHEWVQKKDNDDIVTVGITDFAQHALGDIVYISEPDLNKQVETGDQVGIIDSVKVSADLYTPVSGQITAFNTELANAPELANNDPYGKGWIFKIKITQSDELNDLLSPEEYQKLIERENKTS